MEGSQCCFDDRNGRGNRDTEYLHFRWAMPSHGGRPLIGITMSTMFPYAHNCRDVFNLGMAHYAGVQLTSTDNCPEVFARAAIPTRVLPLAVPLATLLVLSQ